MRSSLFDSSILATGQQAVEFVSNILESSTEYSVIGKDLEGKILLWNEGARRMYGYEAEEVVGRLNSDVLHTPEDVAAGKPREIMESALRDGKWEGVIGRVRKDGRRISARVVITPRRDGDGKPVGFLLISKDISHEIRFAEEIRRTKLFDNAIVGNAKEAVDFIANILESSTEYSIIGKDLDGKILLWNEGARRLYGYEPEEVVGKANSAILHVAGDVDSGKPRELLDAALRDGKWEGTLHRRRKNGQQFTARVVITPRLDSSRKAIGFLLISKDISDEIRLTEEVKATQFYTRSLIESNIDALMTTDPLGIISDVNQQMVALTGYQREELIGTPFKNFFTDPNRAEEGIRLVLREGRILVIEDNSTNLQLMVYLLTAFGHEVLEAHDGNEGIERARREKPDLILLDIHMPQMDGYEAARRLGKMPECCGVPIVAVTALAMVGDREKIMASGFNGYIAKPIDPESFSAQVQSHLGAAPLPRQPVPVASRGEDAPVSAAASKKLALVLFVDNMQTNIDLVRSVLEPSGYEVCAALSAREGIDLAQRAKPDLIVSDVHMPHQDGYEFLRMVQSIPELSEIPFVFLSSSVWSIREQQQALIRGADKFIPRPIEPGVLLSELEEVLHKKKGV